MKLQYKKLTNSLSGTLIENNLSEIEKMYDEGLSLSKISEKLSINYQALQQLFKHSNITIRRGFSYARKHNLNEHYFDIIDSEEKAYILGFIYADGNNFPKLNRISIQLSKIDEDILRKFSHILYNDQILKYYKRYSNNKIFEYVAINLFSKHMSEHIATLGVIEAKSHKITFPQWLDKSLYKHFIRGLIDGDGWIYLPKLENNRDSPNVGLICTRQINDFIKDYLEKELNIKSYIVKAYKQDINIMCEIRIKNYHQCKIFLDWLYKDSTISLNRKYNLYLDFLNRYSNLREQNK